MAAIAPSASSAWWSEYSEAPSGSRENSAANRTYPQVAAKNRPAAMTIARTIPVRCRIYRRLHQPGESELRTIRTPPRAWCYAGQGRSGPLAQQRHLVRDIAHVAFRRGQHGEHRIAT